LEINEYDFVDVYIGDNTTERTPVHNANQTDIMAGFDVVEWICKIRF
jgi:hypothetical protein